MTRAAVVAALLAASGCGSPPREGVREHFNFWPIARYETTEEPPGHALDVLWPLARFETSGAARHTRVLPFYWSDDDGAGRTLTNVLGLFWRRQDQIAGRSSATLWPLLSIGGSADGIEHEINALDLWLVSLYDDAARADGSYSRRLLGLFDHEALALAASYGRKDAAGDAIEEHRHVFPIWFDRRDAAGRSRVWFGGPLLGLESDPVRGLEGVDVLFPLFRWEHEGDGATAAWHARALPLLWFTRRPDASVDFVLPLYGRQSEADGARTRTFVLAPLWVRTTDRQSLLVRDEYLWPLTRFQWTRDGRQSWVFPLWYHRVHGAREHWNLLGLLDTETSEVRDAWQLWPLYAGDASFGEGTRSSWLPVLDLRHAFGPAPSGEETAVLFPLSSFRRDGIGSTSWIFPCWWSHDDGVIASWTHLWPLYGSSRRGSYREVSTLWPLFLAGSDPEGLERRLNVLWPCFHAEWSADGAALWHSWFWLVRCEREPAAAGGAEEFSILGALYRSRIERDQSARSVPFLFGYRRDGEAHELKLLHLIPIRW
jgi:hypothetical protein